MRTNLHEQGKELIEMVQHVRDELANMLNKEANQLEDVKVARSDLADLFSQVALQLNREFDFPE